MPYIKPVFYPCLPEKFPQQIVLAFAEISEFVFLRKSLYVFTFEANFKISKRLDIGFFAKKQNCVSRDETTPPGFRANAVFDAEVIVIKKNIGEAVKLRIGQRDNVYKLAAVNF